MESSIKIDFRDMGDEKGLQPVIAVKLIDSDDTRDKLLKTFFQALGGQSSWLAVEFNHHIIQDVQSATSWITIQPVRPEELKETIDIITTRLRDDDGNFNPLKDRYTEAFKRDSVNQ